MKECENRIALQNCFIAITKLPLSNGKFPFTETGIISAQEEGFREGWQAALEWAANQIRTEPNGYFIILKELEENESSDAVSGLSG